MRVHSCEPFLVLVRPIWQSRSDRFFKLHPQPRSSAMSEIRYTLAAILAVFLLLSTSERAFSFKCQSGTVGQGSCSCSGSNDCTDMRHSKMCSSDLNCSQGACTCTATRVVAPGGPGGVQRGPTLPSGAIAPRGIEGEQPTSPAPSEQKGASK